LRIKSKSEAYSRLLSTNKIIEIRKFRQKIVNFETKSEVPSTAKTVKYLVNDQVAEFLNKQSLCNNLLNNQKFIKSFIKAEQYSRKIWYPLPRKWIHIVNKDEKIANVLICNFLWELYKIKKYSKLIRSIYMFFLKQLIYEPIKFRNRYININKNYVYVNNFHSNMSETGEFNFINWFKTQEKLENSYFVHSNKKFSNSKNVIFYPNFLVPRSLKDRTYLFISALKYLQYYILFSKMKYGFNLNFVELFRTYFICKHYEPSKNIFIFREEMRLCTPIWAHHASLLNERVIYIEQSQSIEPDIEKGIQIDDDFEKLVTWPEVWTVTQERVIYLKKYNENKTKIYRCVGLPWADDLVNPILNFNGNSIAVFDVEPHRKYFGLSTYNLYGLNEIGFSVSFLQDIVECAHKLGYLVYHKPKRNIGRKRYGEYTKLLNTLTNRFPRNYLLISPETSIKRIAENVNFIIATPFTSAIYAGKFSSAKRAYYDPLNTGISTSRDSKVKVIYGRKALSHWLSE